MYIDAHLENSPLEIKTDSSLDSDEKVSVWFYTSGGSYAGGVNLLFTSTPQYELMGCTSNTNFPAAIPTDTKKVWRISLTKTSGIRLVIHCNEVEVLNVLLESTCSSSSHWSHYRSKDVEKISFSSLDTASDYYRGNIM